MFRDRLFSLLMWIRFGGPDRACGKGLRDRHNGNGGYGNSRSLESNPHKRSFRKPERQSQRFGASSVSQELISLQKGAGGEKQQGCGCRVRTKKVFGTKG